MLKMRLNTTLNYSPNFDIEKRRSKQIKFIVYHYTGMKNERQAINKLTNLKSKVSCHYLIKSNGAIIKLVPDLYVAWHAGISFWKNHKSINKNSIGIEITNPGHNIKYKKFSKKQIESIIKLTTFLVNKYKIKRKNILGHSDIAPTRKKDPGEKFPWNYLAKKKISYWHNLNTLKTLVKNRNKKVDKASKIKFIKNLFKIGYAKYSINNNERYFQMLTKAFQRRFRQELINGIVDKECLIISENLIKKFN